MTDTTALVSFDDARLITSRALESTWKGMRGTFHVGRQGWEFADYYRMNVGAREYIVDEDRDFMIFDAPVVLVSKRTGHVSITPWDNDPLNGPASAWTVVDATSPGE